MRNEEDKVIEKMKVRILENVSIDGTLMYAGIVYELEKKLATELVNSSRAFKV